MATGMIMRKKPVKTVPPKKIGATVKMTQAPTSSVKTNVSMGAPQKKFIPGDFNGKHPIDRSTTTATGKSLGENPAKTQARISAQSASKTSYDFGGKNEYSGRNEAVRLPKLTTDVSTTPAKFKMTVNTPATSTGITEKKIQRSGTMMKKRRLPRVAHLQGHGYGRNKRTESGHGR